MGRSFSPFRRFRLPPPLKPLREASAERCITSATLDGVGGPDNVTIAARYTTRRSGHFMPPGQPGSLRLSRPVFERRARTRRLRQYDGIAECDARRAAPGALSAPTR